MRQSSGQVRRLRSYQRHSGDASVRVIPDGTSRVITSALSHERYFCTGFAPTAVFIGICEKTTFRIKHMRSQALVTVMSVVRHSHPVRFAPVSVHALSRPYRRVLPTAAWLCFNLVFCTIGRVADSDSRLFRNRPKNDRKERISVADHSVFR